jgi:hypothetical protein
MEEAGVLEKRSEKGKKEIPQRSQNERSRMGEITCKLTIQLETHNQQANTKLHTTYSHHVNF